MPRKFVFLWGGGSTDSVEDRDLGAEAPLSGVLLNLQMSETNILIRLLQMYFPQNWKFSSALSKFWNFGKGLNTSNPPQYATAST
jgi:hypothetical protein